jgi:hypothetical protein
MAVIINEFEVADGPQTVQRAADPSAASTPAAAALPDPDDLRRLLAECAELQLRRAAH